MLTACWRDQDQDPEVVLTACWRDQDPEVMLTAFWRDQDQDQDPEVMLTACWRDQNPEVMLTACWRDQDPEVMLTACWWDQEILIPILILILIPPASSQQNFYDIHLLLCIQYTTPDDGQRYCPKHVEFYSKNKFEKLVHLVGFIIRITISSNLQMFMC